MYTVMPSTCIDDVACHVALITYCCPIFKQESVLLTHYCSLLSVHHTSGLLATIELSLAKCLQSPNSVRWGIDCMVPEGKVYSGLHTWSGSRDPLIAEIWPFEIFKNVRTVVGRRSDVNIHTSYTSCSSSLRYERSLLDCMVLENIYAHKTMFTPIIKIMANAMRTSSVWIYGATENAGV